MIYLEAMPLGRPYKRSVLGSVRRRMLLRTLLSFFTSHS